MNFCDTCTVRNRAICADLNSDEIAALNAVGRQRALAQGEQLLWEGDDALLVANVIDGILKLSTGTEDGREQIVGLVYPSDFIGRPFGGKTGGRYRIPAKLVRQIAGRRRLYEDDIRALARALFERGFVLIDMDSFFIVMSANTFVNYRRANEECVE